ncbi:Septin 4 [Sparganum proliferum]
MSKIISAPVGFNQRVSSQARLENDSINSTPLKITSNRTNQENVKGNCATSELLLKNPAAKTNMWRQSNVNVGFSTLPTQINRKANQKGFAFNILVVGASGLGKSTFLNSLFMTDIYNDTYVGPSIRFYRDRTTSPVSSATFELVENNVSLVMSVIDTPGFAESLDNSTCWEPILSEIDRRNAAFMDAELTINRKISGCGSHGRLGVFPEQLIHACFYFIEPTGHGLRLVDLKAMRHLCDKVNLIPLIAKADTMTAEECRDFKSVVKEQFQREGIHTYDFPLSALTAEKARDADEQQTSLSEVRTLRLRQPFAVCSGTQEIQKEDGRKVRGRVYPWGIVETDSLEHNDFRALKTLLMCYHMQASHTLDLIDVTYTNHYTNYRLNRLTEAMDAAGFSTQDGRDPLTQLEAEKKAHQARLDKLVQEMDTVYVEKVRERENRLKDTERDMSERIEIMRQQLEAEAEDLARERQRFNDERLSWELDNRDYADSILGSYDKLEKIKKRRGLF